MNGRTAKLLNRVASARHVRAKALKQKWLAAPSRVRARARSALRRLFEQSKFAPKPQE